MKANLVLAIPHRGADDGVASKPSPAPAEARALAFGQLHPVPDERFDSDRHPEVGSEDLRQAVGVAHLTGEEAGEVQFDEIYDRVAVARACRAEADERAQIGFEPVLARAIEADGRLGLRPRAVEQEQESMVEDIEKARKGSIAVVQDALP